MSTVTGSASTSKSLLRLWSRSRTRGKGSSMPVFFMKPAIRACGKKSVLMLMISSPWS